MHLYIALYVCILGSSLFFQSDNKLRSQVNIQVNISCMLAAKRWLTYHWSEFMCSSSWISLDKESCGDKKLCGL